MTNWYKILFNPLTYNLLIKKSVDNNKKRNINNIFFDIYLHKSIVGSIVIEWVSYSLYFMIEPFLSASVAPLLLLL